MKIVIVEDNPALQKSIAKVLTDEGHKVHCFSDGEEARKYIMVEHVGIDMGVIDFMLPSLDGVALIQALRGAEIHIPMLMLTARDGLSDKVKGLESGADYYLTKPFEFDELLACLTALHRRPVTYQNPEYVFPSGMVCNLSTHQLQKGDEVVLLTPTEFGILEYLIRHVGEVVSQHELYEHVFDFAKENWSNTIEVHIKNLRKKLEYKDYENPIITIRGSGYTLQV